MAKRPWMKWYPADWRADAGLRRCSLAARGLWVELLGYMHEAEPYGHLMFEGAPPSIDELVHLVGTPKKVIVAALAELTERRVCDVVDGVIVSRRMVRDHAKEEKDRENGRGGGNPSLKGGVNPRDNGGDKAHIPEARSQRPDIPSLRSGSARRRRERVVLPEVTTEVRDWAAKNTPGIDPDQELPRYHDWLKNAKADHIDQLAGFRNWLRKSADFKQKTGAPNGQYPTRDERERAERRTALGSAVTDLLEGARTAS